MSITQRAFAFRVTAAYVVLATAWITATDLLVLESTDDAGIAYRFQAAKGWLFVLLSGVFVYGLATTTRRRWFSSHAGLIASQREFEEAERVANVGHWIHDLHTDELRWSSGMYRIFGLDPDGGAPGPDSLLALVHPEDRPGVREAMDAVRHGTPLDVTHRIVQPSGATRWVNLRGELQRVDGSAAVQVTGTAHDITDLKLAELRLVEARARARALAAHLEVAREDERHRLAMDIHDVVGSGLAGIRMSLRRVHNDIAGDLGTARRIRRIEDDLDSIIQTVRRVASDLRPVVLDELGLVTAIESLVDEWRSRRAFVIELRVTDDAAVNLPADRGIHIYRIVQESLTNVSRHADAQRVEVVITGRDGDLEVVIRDDGRGFAPRAIRSSSFGVGNMHERAAILGGSLEIRSAPSHGTEVLLRVPRVAGTGLVHA